MNRISNRVIQIIFLEIIILSILTGLFFFVKTLQSTHTDYFLFAKSLRLTYTGSIITVKILTYLPIIIIFSYIAAFSFFFTLKLFQTESFSFVSVAMPAYLLLLFFLVLIVLSQFFFIPHLTKHAEIVQYNARMANSAYHKADHYYKTQEYRDALLLCSLISHIDKNNQKAQKLAEKISREILQRTIKKSTSIEKNTKVPQLVTKDFFSRGKMEFEKENYYAALYYLERALTLHKDNKEILDLYSRCRKKVKSKLGSLTKHEAAKRQLIRQKEKALEYLNKEKYYDAYRVFSLLHKQYPQLDDISLYLTTAEGKLKKIDYLPQTFLHYRALPSWNNLIFFDKKGVLNTIEKALLIKGNYYFFGIRRYYTQTRPLYFKYGKWINGTILAKNENSYKKLSKKEKSRRSIHPFIPPWYLIAGNSPEKIQQQLTIYEWFSLGKPLIESGFNVDSSNIYLAKKMGIFFSTYILSLLLAAFAWRRRSMYDFPSIFKLILFFIVIPIASLLLYNLYSNINHLIIYTHRYFIRFISERPNVFVYTLIINGILSFFATLYFLSQSQTLE